MGKKTSSGLSVVQIIAGALASVSAAVVAAKFGLAGTVIGAAVTSVTITIGSVLYRRSIEHAQYRVRTQFRRPRDEGDSETERISRPRRRLAWGAIASGAALIFVLSMGGLTVFEAIAGAPAARLLSQTSGDARTTVGAVLQNASSDGPGLESPSPVPSETASPNAAMPAATPADAEPTPAPSPTVELTPDAVMPGASDPAAEPSPLPSPETGSPTLEEPSESSVSPAIPPVQPVD